MKQVLAYQVGQLQQAIKLWVDLPPAAWSQF